MSIKNFKALTIKDSFMFFAVMSDPNQCRKLLEMVLEMEILEVAVSGEHTLAYHPDYRGVRLDVLAKEKETLRRFNVEMQAQQKAGLERRSRYYHSQMDMDVLLSGESYETLPDTYVIFVCDFDPFGKKKYRYRFEMTCEETEDKLKDGTYTIFLSTKGENREEVSEELVRFLEYVGDPGSGACSGDTFVSSLESQIAAIKKDREWSGKYMLLEIMMAEERKAGMQEGREVGLQEGREAGLQEGREAGRLYQLVEMCCRKLARGQSTEMIADALEADVDEIRRIVQAAGCYAPNYDAEKICEELLEMQQKSET